LPNAIGHNPDQRVRRALLDWFRRCARPLPWRKRRSPYAIWVSEIMLQQTRVATVIPYYRRFLKAFPTLPALARAPLEQVIELWSGLGYYRRARHLHQAAQVIVERFAGRFPGIYGEARSLPGVGDYTARAVLSLAYGQPLAVLDGNVARVVARIRALHGNLHQSQFRRAVEQDLDRLLSRRRPGDFNQALMELGQTVCLPRAPRCPLCPLRRFCASYATGNPESFPQPRPRRAGELRYLAAAVIRRGDKALLVRGLDEGLMNDLWNFPAAFGTTATDARLRLLEKLRVLIPGEVRLGEPAADLTHGITFRKIRVEVCPAQTEGRAAAQTGRWVHLPDFKTAAVSQLTRKIAASLR
jgi:A/G-specific adenine glycosylase